ncbi:NUDIX hydrolase [Lederbergia graminis]|uniref:NUDIX hydrolase n=1 Tax=Lederbergia graminis TaxID=735518 RepID=A0ABW0LJD8_9BACI
MKEPVRKKKGYVEELRKIVGKRPLILVGAKVLVFNEHGHILLQNRTDTNKWGLPGGLMELGESLEETAVREVQEETGLEIAELQLVKILSGKDYFIKLPNGDPFYSVNTIYTTNTIVGGTLQADGVEGTDVQFFPIDQLPPDINPQIKDEIDAYMKTKSNEQ